MDPVSRKEESVRAERPALAAGIGSVCFRLCQLAFFARYRRGMALFTNGQRGKTVQCIFCHGKPRSVRSLKTSPVYARHISAAEEILRLIYAEFYFGNFHFGTGRAAKMRCKTF